MKKNILHTNTSKPDGGCTFGTESPKGFSKSKLISFVLFLFLFCFTGINSQAQLINVNGDDTEWPGILNNVLNLKKAFRHDVETINGRFTTEDQFTHGSKDEGENPNTDWTWVNGQVNDKGNIQNAGAIMLTNPANGHKILFFFGDRTADNGDAQIGFWFFLDDVHPAGTGQSASPFTGEHRNGDLLIISNFTNGGGSGQPLVYRWEGKTTSDPGGLKLINPAIVNALIATNPANGLAVPEDGVGATGFTMFNGEQWVFAPKNAPAATYQRNLFFEGSVDLGTIPDVNPCFQSFLLETRNSQSLDASLQDFTAGRFTTTPTCDIAGNDNNFCPGTTHTYTGPAGMTTYAWTVTGNGSIVGPANAQTVQVQAGAICGPFTLQLATTLDGCTGSPCSLPRNVTDTQPPVINNVPAGGYLGCNPTLPSCSTLTATDNCAGTLPVSCTPGAITGPACSRSQTFTYSVTDACGNNDTDIVTYTWKEDTTAPVISNLPAGGNLGCNPTLPSCSTAGTATDNCDGSRPVSCTPGAITGPACSRSQTFRYSASDLCGNTANSDVTYTWKEDTTAPVISNLPSGGNLGCNPTLPSCSTAGTATDNCDGSRPVSCTPGAITGPACSRSQTFRYSASDLCGNTANSDVTYTWKEDTTAPVISNLPAGGNLGCNPTLPSCSTAGTATDNCDGSRPVSCTPGAITGPACSRSQTFRYSASDLCGNTANSDVTYTWKEDTTAPVISNLPAGGNLGCNPTLPSCSTAGTATDNCDGSRPVSCTPGAITGPACSRSQTFRYSASDLCGNTANSDVTYTWKEDTTAPVFSGIDDRVITGGFDNGDGPCGPDLGGGGKATVNEKVNNLPKIQDASINFSQPRNVNHPEEPINWTYGINNMTQADYFEGMGVPQRIIFTQLSGNKHTFRFRHEAVKHQDGDRHAYDFLMSWEQAIATAANIGNGAVNELQNLIAQQCDENISADAATACKNFTTNAYATVQPTMGNPPNHHGNRNVNDVIACFEQQYGERKIEIKGNAAISDFKIVFEGYSGTATGDNYAWYTISWTSTSSDVMIKLAGRPAQGGGACGYGNCYGAGDIHGGPYHFKLDKLDNSSLGDRDNQVMVAKTGFCVVDIPVTFDRPTVLDNCPSGTITPTIVDSDIVTPNADGSLTHCRTWRAVDDCNNPATARQCITVICVNQSVTGKRADIVSQNKVLTSTRVAAYPNPFRNHISFEISSDISAHATLQIINLLGQRVIDVYDGQVNAGVQTIEFDSPKTLGHGAYIYLLKMGDKEYTGKIINME